MAKPSLSQSRHRVSPHKSTVLPAPARPTPTALTLADVEIHWSHVHAGASLVPVLRFGGSQAISTHLSGLCDVLEGFDILGEDALVFVRRSLREMAERLYDYTTDPMAEDHGAAANCRLVVRAKGGA